mmetsp:Transcript_15832/g.24647  ORF Transcript_15832/g.24647 Transcript_15832/m.24647 type:complete len:154 (-) Transcript_15832:90-551(-)|eukprot:CAMPEP_0195301530 /NCGR_PEP_ID=MMETSP0707-20130614/29437_1 /TAXON_ID=33640 /ORGANISM="Asterionellopsis glacialis, Strain CCMP134" /LENGTH=153 /DNA_ID=CAMNT_0040364493 /DNA_START=182 /DNA_END=643 /DNA_ORIENTATION=-
MPPKHKKLKKNESSEKSHEKKKPKDADEDGLKINAKKAADAGGGLDEIDALFEDQKNTKKKRKLEEEEQEQVAAQKRRAQQHAKNSKLQYNRHDVMQMSEREWTDDGLGGKFNKEGFTGRKHDGVKVFKAHLFNKPNFGETPNCPFDCDCCYI